MGTPVKGSGTIGRGHQDVGDLLQVGGAGGPTIWVRGVSDVPTHQEDARRLSPTGNMPTDGVAEDMEVWW